MPRSAWFVLGNLTAVLVLAVGAYLFVKWGGVPMKTTERPLPLERKVARMALRAAIGSAARQPNPVPVDAANMLAGARIFRENCRVCHGAPDVARTAIAKGMSPDPPRLFEKKGMVTRDPEGVTYWKVTHGIRLSGMPGFDGSLSETERWQVTMLLAHADRLAADARAELTR